MQDGFLGIDVSTTASKALIIDETGRVVASHSVLHDPFSVANQPLWSEQNPENWVAATIEAIRTAVAATPKNMSIKSLALTGQMQGLVILDKNKTPLRKAILWNDQRSAEECDEIAAALSHDFLCQHIGSKILPCHLLSKLLWVKKHEPEVFSRIAYIITPKDYVRFCLSGELAVDASDASGFAMMDIAKRVWSATILENQNIPTSWLPRIYASTEICGKITPEASEKTGLKIETPIATGAGDQPAQSVGCGMVREGLMSLQIGTSGVVTQIGPYAPASNGSFLDYCHAKDNQWIAMGLTAAAAGSFRWFRDNVAMKKYSFTELDALAATTSHGADGLLFVPDICGNIHPHGDALARGHFIGLKETHTLAHMARAVLEGVALSLKELADSMCQLSGIDPESYMISGGAANSPLWTMIFAEVMQKPLYTVNSNEGAAFGAAIIAGVAISYWPTLDAACETLVQKTATITPTEVGKQRYRDLFSIWQKTYHALKTINHELMLFQKKTSCTKMVEQTATLDDSQENISCSSSEKNLNSNGIPVPTISDTHTSVVGVSNINVTVEP